MPLTQPGQPHNRRRWAIYFASIALVVALALVVVFSTSKEWLLLRQLEGATEHRTHVKILAEL